jgi:fumarate reductase subunit C
MKGKEYVRPLSSSWYLQRPSWTRFIFRELTAVFVGAYAIFLLVLVYRARDAQSFAAFYDGLRSPLSLIFHLLVLVMAFYHSITWFNLAPMALPLQRGEEHVAPNVISGTLYAAWVIVSVVIAGIVLAVR